MKLGIACALVGFAAVCCGSPARNFKGTSAGAGGRDNEGDGSGKAAGHGGVGDAGASAEAGADSEAGAAGMAGTDSEAGAAGMAGATNEPPEVCLEKCDSPPAAVCKNATTRTTYASSGTCKAGECNYTATDTPCSDDAAKCKSGASAQCVACLANADCNNSGICDSSNACVCTNRFNGKHCEFQVFRGLGTLLGDASSSVINISHDGKVVVGTSSPSTGPSHAFRAVNGGPMQFIPKPTSATGASYCYAQSVDSNGNVLLSCDDREVFLYSTAGVATAVATPASASAYDISLDGNVIVGRAGDQAVRRASSVNTLLGPLQPGGSSWFSATNGDGSVAVGGHYNTAGPGVLSYISTRWTAATGMVALPALSTWTSTSAADVSADGQVIVGWASLESEILSGQLAVKWIGTSLSPTALGASAVAASANAVNLDGSVIVGARGYPTVPMLWDGTGEHTVTSLLGSTPDLTSDWTLNSAVGVSDDGKFVVGTGTHGSSSEAWVVHLP